VVGAAGFEPVTPSVSGHARPFARSAAALHGTTSALLRSVTESGAAVRREAPHGIAADKLLTAGRELHSIWRTSVRAGRPMADRCSFCGSTAGPFSKVEGLFTVLMCADCQAARGHGTGPYPVCWRCSPGLYQAVEQAVELDVCRSPVPCCSRSSRGVAARPVSNLVSIGVPVPSGRGRLWRSGPPRPGTDRPAEHGKADESLRDSRTRATGVHIVYIWPRWAC
jgi:hypothetical protein